MLILYAKHQSCSKEEAMGQVHGTANVCSKCNINSGGSKNKY